MDLGNYWWAYAIGILLAGLFTPFVGYFKRVRSEAAQSTISGAVVMDSSLARNGIAVGEDMAVSLRRMADALDKKVDIERERDARKAAHKHESEIETLRREIADLKRGKG